MAEQEVDHGYRGPLVCKIVGITYRQLDYWARTDLVRPSVCDANGAVRAEVAATSIASMRKDWRQCISR